MLKAGRKQTDNPESNALDDDYIRSSLHFYFDETNNSELPVCDHSCRAGQRGRHTTKKCGWDKSTVKIKCRGIKQNKIGNVLVMQNYASDAVDHRVIRKQMMVLKIFKKMFSSGHCWFNQHIKNWQQNQVETRLFHAQITWTAAGMEYCHLEKFHKAAEVSKYLHMTTEKRIYIWTANKWSCVLLKFMLAWALAWNKSKNTFINSEIHWSAFVAARILQTKIWNAIVCLENASRFDLRVVLVGFTEELKSNVRILPNHPENTIIFCLAVSNIKDKID